MIATPIVFAPGMMCDDRLFERQAAALRAGRGVAFADFSKDDSIAGMARRLLAAAPARCVLVGLSMGGIVAFEAWRQARELIAGLVLLNTTPFADAPARRAVRLSQIDRAREGRLQDVVLEELKPTYLGAARKDDRTLLDAIYAMAERLGPEVFVRQSHALMTRADSVETLASIDCPTLIIAGEADEVCPPELHETMHDAIAGSSLRVLSGCGHLSAMEAPDAVATLLRDWIEQLEKGERNS